MDSELVILPRSTQAKLLLVTFSLWQVMASSSRRLHLRQGGMLDSSRMFTHISTFSKTLNMAPLLDRMSMLFFSVSPVTYASEPLVFPCVHWWQLRINLSFCVCVARGCPVCNCNASIYRAFTCLSVRNKPAAICGYYLPQCLPMISHDKRHN